MTKKNSTATILVLVIACIVLFWLTGKKYFLPVAVLLGFSGLFSSYVADKIHWLWMKLGEGLGYVTGRIIMTLIFFLLLYPLSLLSKLFRKNNQLKPGAESYFEARNFVYTRESMENTW